MTGSYGGAIFFRIVLLLYVASWDVVLSQYRQRQFIRNSVTTSRYDVSYSELQALKADCYPKDTCGVLREKDDIMDSYCHCGRICSMLDTCCVDSRYRPLTRIPYGTKHRCQTVLGQYPPRAFMVDKCERNYVGEDYFRQMCTASPEAMSDPLLYIAGTNTRTRTTYRNLYCALCNGEDIKDIVFFNLHMFITGNDGFKKVDPSEFTKVSYWNGTHDDRDEWAIQWPGWRFNRTNTVYFNLEIPPRVQPFVVMCPPRDIISACASNWTDSIVARKCASYMAITVSIDWNRRYRNVHCALCNYITVDNLSCRNETGADPGQEGRTPFNLGFLLDVNPSTGPLVARQRKCRANHIYHPTKNICIPLAGCFIGHVFKDGECVRKTG